NFHGEPLALALDFAGIALSELGSISERRLFRLLTAHLSDLPPFLSRRSGVNTGYMLLQYTAAALATDNALLATPASVHSLPTSADQEDHVSMGWHSALRAGKVADNVEAILALEALAAAQGIDLLAPLRPGPQTAKAHALIRARVPTLEDDRAFGPEIEAVRALVLVVYGGTGKAARDWPAFHAIVAALRRLADDETLLVQSGKPVGVFSTHEYAPRVLVGNSLLVPRWATWDDFRELERLGLIMYGQMTAGSWIYIGSQGILQGTFETFNAVAASRFDG